MTDTRIPDLAGPLAVRHIEDVLTADLPGQEPEPERSPYFPDPRAVRVRPMQSQPRDDAGRFTERTSNSE